MGITWSEAIESIGFIGIELPDGWQSRYAAIEASMKAAQSMDEPVAWQHWLTHLMPTEKLQFADRLGRHLWVYAVFPDHDNGRVRAVQWEELARMLCEKLAARHYGTGLVSGKDA